MALNSSETVVAGNGNVYVAAVGTTYPANPSTSVGAGWTEVGLIDEAGVQFQPSQNVVNFMAWQKQYAVRTSITSRGLKVAMVLEQWNEFNFPLALGGGAITGSGPYTFAPATSGSPDERALLVRAVDGSKKYDLKVYRCMATDLAGFTLNKQSMSTLALALELLEPASGDTYNVVADDAAFAA